MRSLRPSVECLELLGDAGVYVIGKDFKTICATNDKLLPTLSKLHISCIYEIMIIYDAQQAPLHH